MRVALLSLCLLPLMVSCTNFREFTRKHAPKSIAPRVIAAAQKEDAWYEYMPEKAPKFCLKTKNHYEWNFPGLDFGHWIGYHPRAPYRRVMEAQGSRFIIYRNFVWDGVSVGSTGEKELEPSLVHDALYNSLKEGSNFPRRNADLVYLRLMRKNGAPIRGLTAYMAVRLMGGFYNSPDPKPTLIVVHQ